jgi:hypothetical protein
MDLQGVVVVNATTLYYELTGTGPAVLFIAGTTGDAGHFAQVAARLVDEFTVVTYDRRGNSRSPHPAGWTQTSVPERAEDAGRVMIRTFTVEELETLPPLHEARMHPDVMIRRQVIVSLELPPLLKVANRVEVIFRGCAPKPITELRQAT